jgi:predicted flap endonuclease-1-like 5' DNA nuclease
MLYNTSQLLAMSLLSGVAAAIITWAALRSHMLRMLTRQRTELDARLAWRAVEHENAMTATQEALRVAHEGKREAEQRLLQGKAELAMRSGQSDDMIAGLHRNLRSYQDKVRELQERLEMAESRASSESEGRGRSERTLAGAEEKIRELEARVASLIAAQRGPDRETMTSMEQRLRAALEANRELEVRLKTAQAGTTERAALERRLVEAQERARSAEGELTALNNELSRLRVANQAKVAILEGRIRDHEKEIEFAEARIDAVAAEAAQSQATIVNGLERDLAEMRRLVTMMQRGIDERDGAVESLQVENGALRERLADDNAERVAAEALAQELRGVRATLAARELEVAARDAELTRQNGLAAQQTDRIVALEEELRAAEAALAAELRSAEAALRSREEALGESEAAVARLSVVAEAQGARIEALDAALRESQAAAAEREAVTLALEEELRGARAALAAAEDALSESGVGQGVATATQVAALEEALAAASAEAARATALENDLRGALRSLRESEEEIARLDAALAAAQGPGSGGDEAELARLMMELRQRDREVARLGAELDEARAEMLTAQALGEGATRVDPALVARNMSLEEEVAGLKDMLSAALAERERGEVEARARAEALAEALAARERGEVEARARAEASAEALAERERGEVEARARAEALAEALAERERGEVAARARAEALAAALAEREQAAVETRAAHERASAEANAALRRELAEQRAAQQAKLVEMKDELWELRHRLRATEERLEQSGIMAQEQISAHDEELTAWQTRIHESARLLAELEGQRSAQAQEIAALEGQRSAQAQEIAALAARLAAAGSVGVAGAAGEAEVGAQATAEEQAELERLARELAATAAAKAQLEDEVAALKATLEAAQGTIARSERRLQAVTLMGEPDFDPQSPDDLKCISGIGPVIERRLREAGIVTYRQLAILDDAAIEAMDGPMAALRGKLRREDWVEQAKKFHVAKYGEAL